MPPKAKTVGGGNAKGVSNDFFEWLSRGLNTGKFANQSGGFGSIFDDIFSQGAGKFGGDLASMINRSNTNNVADIRARYGAGGGMGYGTPAAQAEASYDAQHAADTGVAIGGLQLQAMQSLFPLYQQANSIGTPQAQTIMQQNPWAAGFDVVSHLANAGANIAKGNPFGGGTPAASTNPPASGATGQTGDSGYFDFQDGQ